MKRPYTIYVDDSMSEEELKKLLGDKIILADGVNKLPPPSDGKAVAKLMEEMAKAGGLTSFDDNPSEWHREQRVDRKLPFRDE